MRSRRAQLHIASTIAAWPLEAATARGVIAGLDGISAVPSGVAADAARSPRTTGEEALRWLESGLAKGLEFAPGVLPGLALGLWPDRILPLR
mmetsp:Transcript_25640/g.55728  ORF Transcript_25640/g.55728 Transcript_25640/m.55728 type:complete len:92 (+) Transcript_25640:1187-1462(+)